MDYGGKTDIENARMMRKGFLSGFGRGDWRGGGVFGPAVGVSCPAAALAPQAADTYRQLNLLGDAFSDYVEKPDESKLVRQRSTACCPRSIPTRAIWTPSFRDIRVQTKGVFGGLGIDVSLEDETHHGSPYLDRRHAGGEGRHSLGRRHHRDRQRSRTGLTLNQAVDKMRGAVSTPVTLKVVHDPNKDVEEIVRDVIKIPIGALARRGRSRPSSRSPSSTNRPMTA